jgi:Zn-dependent oligopeptidase
MTEQGIIRKPDWTIDPATMRSIAVEEMKNKKEKLDEIAKTPAGKVGLKTLQDFEEVLGSDDPLGYFLFIKHVSSNKEQRDMADDIEKEVRKFYNEIWGRKDLYDVIVQLEPEME